MKDIFTPYLKREQVTFLSNEKDGAIDNDRKYGFSCVTRESYFPSAENEAQPIFPSFKSYPNQRKVRKTIFTFLATKHTLMEPATASS